jgi:hypothetical protein
LVLIDNFGAAPVQNGYAEFSLAPTPPMVEINPAPAFAYQRSAMVPDASWTSLGVSTFSLSSSIAEDGEMGWALSPRTWTALQLGPCGVVQVFEPIHDGPSGRQKSWEDRKLAFRAFNPNFAGSWVGTEVDVTTGAALGPVELVITQNWKIADKGGVQAWTPTCFIHFVNLPSLPPAGSSEGTWSTMYGSLYYTDIRPAGTLNMIFTFRRDGSLDMHLVKNNGASRSITSLTLRNPGALPPAPDKSLLGRVRQIIPPYWSAQRKADARAVYAAISAVLP